MALNIIPLVAQQPLLHGQPSAKADQLAVCPQNPVAWDNNGDGIGAAAGTCAPGRAFAASAPGGQRAVGDDLSVWNGCDLLPYLALIRGSPELGGNGKMKGLARMVKLVQQLDAGLL